MEHITDICELSNEGEIISCLKQRFLQGEIYVSPNAIDIKLDIKC